MLLPRSTRSWFAAGLAWLWLCAGLAPILHQPECVDHGNADERCPICQFATTSVIATPASATPSPAWHGTPHLMIVWTPAPALLFQGEHPPRGPPLVSSNG